MTHEEALITHMVSQLPWQEGLAFSKTAVTRHHNDHSTGRLRGSYGNRSPLCCRRVAFIPGVSAEGVTASDTSPPKREASISHSTNAYWTQVYSEVLGNRLVLWVSHMFPVILPRDVCPGALVTCGEWGDITEIERLALVIGGHSWLVLCSETPLSNSPRTCNRGN